MVLWSSWYIYIYVIFPNDSIGCHVFSREEEEAGQAEEEEEEEDDDDEEQSPRKRRKTGSK